MSLLPFGDLPAFKPRQFVPKQFNAGDWAQIAPLMDRLEERGSACSSSQELERWILDWSELNSVVDEEGARRYIAMTCNTESKEAEQAYLHFVEKIEPELKPRQFKLARTLCSHPKAGELPSPRYDVFLRDMRVQVELFRPENVALETEEAKLSQQYQKLSGSLTVSFQGKEQTLVQMARYLEEPDRNLRQKAWELVANRRLAEADQFEQIFDRLVQIRDQIARNAGFPNYRDYAFRRLGRFDYTPDDCSRFHEAVELEIMPLVRKAQAERRKQLQLDAVRPWDINVDPLNRPALAPFQDTKRLIAGTQTIFDKLDPELGRGFRLLDDMRLLDLANRKGKGPGGYQWSLNEARLPFIFMNAVGLQRDVETILHEAGHAFHALATQNEDLHAYRNPPIEFCEVASMSMELLGNEYLEEFYSDGDAKRARHTHLETILRILPWIATIDAFQHWIYTHPKHTREERAKAWCALMDRFEGDVDWSGHEKARAHLWHRQLHLYTNAFYYIEYGIAQLGALHIWANSHADKQGALNKYKAALKLGGSRPLPELFKAAGCPFDFSRNAIVPLVALIEREMAKTA